ncbi:Com family DNA-binding transcriptional regulator [Moraxella atlantae]|uniref:Mu-like prophage protein Com n=1 Tax=Faucicola atlantae TaxID=34059 RepID=A0A378Q783_9GAMM|nr:hypothetical protein B5J92_05780 [Moraxella atlantae]STY95057.1 Mu-like prophage protein Com [Moraxella atlantae]
MQDYRCNACAKLLFRIAGEAVVAVKCPRCKTLNQLTLTASINPNAIERPCLERPERHYPRGCHDATFTPSLQSQRQQL